MSQIVIPSAVLQGFKFIQEMNETDMKNVLLILDNIQPGQELEDIHDEIDDVLKTPSKLLLQTILSFIGLLDKDGATIENVSKNLAESYFEGISSKVNNEKIEILKKNISQILFHSRNLKKNVLSKRSLYENESILRRSNLITDMRLIFDEDLKDKNRSSIIIHKLHIEYQKDFENKELYLALDLKDLNKLKLEIDKAIEKDQIIREDYKENLNFLF